MTRPCCRARKDDAEEQFDGKHTQQRQHRRRQAMPHRRFDEGHRQPTGRRVVVGLEASFEGRFDEIGSEHGCQRSGVLRRLVEPRPIASVIGAGQDTSAAHDETDGMDPPHAVLGRHPNGRYGDDGNVVVRTPLDEPATVEEGELGRHDATTIVEPMVGLQPGDDEGGAAGHGHARQPRPGRQVQIPAEDTCQEPQPSGHVEDVVEHGPRHVPYQIDVQRYRPIANDEHQRTAASSSALRRRSKARAQQ